MTFGFILLAGGLALLYSGIKGVSVADVFKGAIGDSPFWDKVNAATSQAGGDASAVGDTGGGGSAQGGARGIVDAVAARAASFGTIVVSGYRPGSVTTSGNASDHSHNDANQAARDIGVKGVDALKGPPPKELDQAIVAVGNYFGKSYSGGKPIVDTFQWHGYRIQIIWRVPSYGGHMGHIHVGARKTTPLLKPRRGAHKTR
jgi:hypothetical protein